MDQLIRWAYTEVQEESLGKFGLHVKVISRPPVLLFLLAQNIHHVSYCLLQVQRTVREGIAWGFVSSIMRDGATVTDISVSFDEESTHKYEWVGRKADGFPKLEGNAEEILGKHFVIRYSVTAAFRSSVLLVKAYELDVVIADCADAH